jgi:apolipoprotein N-acyltransferase
MRAVESKRYLARCGNTGISGFLTPLGTSLQRTEIDTQAAIAQTLPLLTEQTLYVRFGDWLPMASCLLVALALGAALFGGGHSRES